MTTTGLITFDQFIREPQTKPYREFACGEVWERPMPNKNHARIQLRLGMTLDTYLYARRLGEAFSKLELRLGPPHDRRSYVADLCVYLWSTISPDVWLTLDYPTVPPDVAVEILSPGQPDRRFTEKIAFYLAVGVRLVWVVDPEAQTVQVLSPGAPAVELDVTQTLRGGDVLPGFELPIAEIFRINRP